MIRLVAFEPGHVHMIDAAVDEHMPYEGVRALQQGYTTSGVCERTGRYLFAAGLFPLSDGEGYVWARQSARVSLAQLRFTLRVLLSLIDAMPVSRVCTDVRCDYEQGAKFMRALGFERQDETRVLDGHRYARFLKVK